ncbi:hypothetical protein ANO11243_066440 [Dothideomycetidae sp. 11243]|nr:hypothetical protein ANO11243_066440 [fungal sp. No.11243]
MRAVDDMHHHDQTLIFRKYSKHDLIASHEAKMIRSRPFSVTFIRSLRFRAQSTVTSPATHAPNTTSGSTSQSQTKTVSPAEKPVAKRTPVESDADMVARMKAALGERDGGGSSGVEYEDGKPVAMKRGVRENMFRLI